MGQILQAARQCNMIFQNLEGNEQGGPHELFGPWTGSLKSQRAGGPKEYCHLGGRYLKSPQRDCSILAILIVIFTTGSHFYLTASFEEKSWPKSINWVILSIYFCNINNINDSVFVHNFRVPRSSHWVLGYLIGFKLSWFCLSFPICSCVHYPAL